MTVDLVVIGLGYVGLPLACEASAAGLEVVGFDLAKNVITNLNSGHSHVDTVSDTDVAQMVAAGFRATDLEAEIGRAGYHRHLCSYTAVARRHPGPRSRPRRGATSWSDPVARDACSARIDELPGDHR